MVRTILFFMLALFLASSLIWFGLERMALYFELHSPYPKRWAIVYITNGEVLYGRLRGVTKEVMKLTDVHAAELFRKVASRNPEGNFDGLEQKQISLDVSFQPSVDEKVIFTERSKALFLNRSSVVYWEITKTPPPLSTNLREE